MLSPFYKQSSWDSRYLRHLTNTQLVIDRVGIQSKTYLMPKTYALSLYHFNRWQKALLSDLLDQDGRDSNLDSSTWCFLCWGSINHGWAWNPVWKYKRALRQNFLWRLRPPVSWVSKRNSFSCTGDLDISPIQGGALPRSQPSEPGLYCQEEQQSWRTQTRQGHSWASERMTWFVVIILGKKVPMPS